MAYIPTDSLRNHDKLRESLMDAIIRDDALKIGFLVKRGAPLYEHYMTSELGMITPMEWAVLKLRFRAAMQLLELGDGKKIHTEMRPRPAELPEINMAVASKTALALAAIHGHLGLMRMLLERGVDVGQVHMLESNFQGSRQRSALNVAVDSQQTEAVALLLQYGAWDVQTDKDSVLALARLRGVDLIDYASAAKQQATMDRENGLANATPETLTTMASTPRGGGTPMEVASPAARKLAWSREGCSNAFHPRVRSPLQEGTSIGGWAPFQSWPGSTPLAVASGGALALQPGADSVTHELTSAQAALRGELKRAIKKGDVHAIRSLVMRGAPLHASCDLGFGEQGNCIDWACVSAKPAVALTLLEIADETGGPSFGNALAVGARAAFFWAVSQGYLEVLRELLSRGVDVCQTPPQAMAYSSLDGCEAGSALGIAVYGLRKFEVLELLRHGAWERATDAEREQFLAWAQHRKPIAEAFREAGICSFDELLAVPEMPFPSHGFVKAPEPQSEAVSVSAEVPPKPRWPLELEKGEGVAGLPATPPV